MHSNYALVAWTLGFLFVAIGLVHLAGPRFVRNAYDRWEYSQGLRWIVGFVEIVIGVWLADPALRLWGIGFAAVINFGAVLTLLNHRQYLHATPGIVMMIALLPATLAVPVTHHSVLSIAPLEASASPSQDDLKLARYEASEVRAGWSPL